MKDLVKRPEQLPDTVEKLNKYIQVGKQKLKAYEAKLKAVDISASEYNEMVRKKAYQDTFELAVALLYAEARLGELLGKINLSEKRASSAKGTCSLPPGINKKQSHYAQELSGHKEIIEEIILQREAKEEIPKRTDVLNLIKKLKREQELEKIKKRINKENLVIKNKYDVVILDPPWKYGRKYEPSGSRVAPVVRPVKVIRPWRDNFFSHLLTFEQP